MSEENQATIDSGSTLDLVWSMESHATLPILHLWDKKLYLICLDSITIINFDQGLFTVPIPAGADASSVSKVGVYKNTITFAGTAKHGEFVVVDMVNPSAEPLRLTNCALGPVTGRYVSSKQFLWGIINSGTCQSLALIPGTGRTTLWIPLEQRGGSILCCNEDFVVFSHPNPKNSREEHVKFRTINMGNDSELLVMQTAGALNMSAAFVGDEQRRFVLLSSGKLHVISITNSLKFDAGSAISCPVSRYHMFINFAISAPYLFALSQAIMKPLDLSLIVYDLSSSSSPSEPKLIAKIPLELTEVPKSIQAFCDNGVYSIFFLMQETLECYQVK